MGTRLLSHRIALFTAVCEQGSFRRAAEKLSMSQPAVSEQINLLERSLGSKLFVRSPTGAKPTDAGRFLYDQVIALGKAADNAVTQTQIIAGHHPRLRVGIGEMQHSLLLDDVSYEFARRYPGVRLEHSIYDASQSINMVLDGNIDVVEFWHSPGIESTQCICTPVLELRPFCAVPRDHPLATLDVINPADLANERIATNADGVFSAIDAVKSELRSHATNLSFVDTDLNTPMEHYVMAGMVAIVPEGYQPQGSYTALAPLSVTTRIEVSLLTARDASETVLRFVELALEMSARPTS